MLYERSTLIEAQYYCREIQVQKITEGVREYKSSPESALLTEAIFTPPIGFPDMLRFYGLSVDEFFAKIRSEVVNFGKLARMLHILSDLERACSPDNKNLSEIPIDIVDEVLPVVYKALYIDRMGELREINAQRLDLASTGIMKLLEGTTPLIRYRKDIVQAHFELKPGFTAGTQITEFPTKVPNVNLVCFYPREKNIPQLSLLIEPFS